jgi:hypothetical protein
MRNLLIFLLLLIGGAGVLTSCQKEITGAVTKTDSTNNNGGSNMPPSTNGELLIKVDGKSGADSNVTYYTYNSAKKVITRRLLSSSIGQSTNAWYGFQRDSAGLIVQSKSYTQVSFSPMQADTITTIFRYSTGNNPTLTYSTSFSAGLFADSTVYTYGSNGHVAKVESYQSNLVSGTLSLVDRDVFTYDGAGNLVKQETYLSALGTILLSRTQTFEWDNKLPPITFSEAESLIITTLPAPLHNLTRTTTTGNGIDLIVSQTYTYNSANKPATSVMTSETSGLPTIKTNFTVYYQ